MSNKKSTSEKTTTKKPAAKKTAEKKVIEGRVVARNVILVIDGKKISKAFKVKADRENVMSLVAQYNKRNSLKKENEIIEIMQKGKTTEKQRRKAVTKKTSKKVTKPKAVIKAVPVMTLEEAKQKLIEDGYTISKNAPKPEPTPRERSGREY